MSGIGWGPALKPSAHKVAYLRAEIASVWRVYEALSHRMAPLIVVGWENRARLMGEQLQRLEEP